MAIIETLIAGVINGILTGFGVASLGISATNINIKRKDKGLP